MREILLLCNSLVHVVCVVVHAIALFMFLDTDVMLEPTKADMLWGVIATCLTIQAVLLALQAIRQKTTLKDILDELADSGL